MNCPECGTQLPDNAEFCSGCGVSTATECSHCGESVPVSANFCSGCGADLSARGSNGRGAEDEIPSGSAKDDDVFRLGTGVFARRVSGDHLDAGGILGRIQNKKRVKIESGNEALVLRNGELAETLPPGKHTLDSVSHQLLETRKSHSLTAVLVQRGDTPLTLTVSGLLTADDVQVTVELGLVASVADEEAFFRNLMSDREAVTRETFRTLIGPAIQDELQAHLSEYERSELYGNNELKRDLEAAVKERTGDVLARNGMELLSIRSFEYEDGRDDIREQRTELSNRAEREDLTDTERHLDQRARKRETEDSMHASRQQAREDLTENAARHEVEMQETDQRHEKADTEREHRHTAERENVEHTEEVETRQTEGEVTRRDLEHEQDMSEMKDMMDLKDEKERLDIEREEERIEAREDVDAKTLASLDDTDEVMDDLARMDAAEDLSAEQLDSLGARESDELAKARQEANRAEVEKQRVEDQKEFREDLKDVTQDAMDRTQQTSESAMDNMGETASETARDTPETEVYGRGESNDTTVNLGNGSNGEAERVRECPECNGALTADDAFCTDCGADLAE